MFKCKICKSEYFLGSEWTVCACGEVYENVSGNPVRTGRNIQKGDSVTGRKEKEVETDE